MGKKIGAPRKYNRYILKENYGVGFTNKGQEFYFDLEDFDKIKSYCWVLHKSRWGYYVEARDIKNKNSKTLKMHRLVMNAEIDKKIDHINRITVNNQKSNLRIVGDLENQHNRGERKDNKTGRNGVMFRKDTEKYRVRIGLNYKEISVGQYDTLEGAIVARKNAEIKYYGEYARID